MTQFSCVGVESKGARGLCGLTAGAQGHNRSSDLTQKTEQNSQRAAYKLTLETSETQDYFSFFFSKQLCSQAWRPIMPQFHHHCNCYRCLTLTSLAPTNCNSCSANQSGQGRHRFTAPLRKTFLRSSCLKKKTTCTTMGLRPARPEGSWLSLHIQHANNPMRMTFRQESSGPTVVLRRLHN